MRSRLLSRGTHQWLISILLVALAVRALVPVGFMPSSERPFTLQICPDGFPAWMLHGASGTPNEHAAHHHRAADGGPSAALNSALAHEQGAQHSGHGSHQHGSARAEHCVFAAAASAGPALHLSIVVDQVDALAAPQFPSAPPLLEIQRFRVQQPRAPPTLS